VGEPVKAVFDTNILIDYLNGIEPARQEITQYQLRKISVITFIEVMVGAKDSAEEKAIREFLASFDMIALSAEIAQETIALRKDLRLRIPDAIVYASARTEGCLLVSRNTKDLKPEWPDVRVPYQI
jgi:predicted nucleic acid-binding protein